MISFDTDPQNPSVLQIVSRVVYIVVNTGKQGIDRLSCFL